MPSELTPTEAYVWVWLPGATEPVVAGILETAGQTTFFNYGQSYLELDGAIPLYLPELPLRSGRQRPPGSLRVAGCISDAAPDAWGQRVIRHRLLGRPADDAGDAELGLLTYLLESGSARVGALDFQVSPHVYEDRSVTGTLDELLEAADRLEAGEPFSPVIDEVLLAGSSLGGARPKVALNDNGRHLIAKFSSKTDSYPVERAEGVAMDLARRVGLDVAPTEVIECLGHDVLLVDRFDRTATPGERRMVVSALTLFGLEALVAARHAAYHDLTDIIRARFTKPGETLRELFSRIVFNIAVGNTDDHARNHAAFWDGAQLTLTPAYDICPQMRSGGEASQAMEIAPGFRLSQLAGCVDAASAYQLSATEAREIIDRQLGIINTEWADAADAARLTEAERLQLWGRQILNPFALEGYHPGD